MPTSGIYEPLPGVEWFRLLRISRDASGAISGDLQNFSLDPASCPRFVSFSYAWGESSAKRTISLCNQEFTILDNVYRLLEVVCAGNGFAKDIWLWIDSICINQDDLNERASQVSLMGKIYRHERARKTVVWLGEGTAETDIGMDFMHALVAERDAIHRNNKKNGGSRTVPANLNDAAKWKAVAVVFDRSWWRRVWTLQEFIIAPQLDLFCGTKSISRTKMRIALHSIWLCCPGERLIRDESWNPAWTRRRLHQWYMHDDYWDKMGLLALMAYSGSCAVTDPRDRIYGLLGLARSSDVAMVGRPTYAYDVGSVYIAFVKAWICTYHSLDIICFAQLFTGRESGVDVGLSLPSWVPDWTLPMELFVVPLMVSQSGRDHIANFRPILNQELVQSPSVYAAAGQELPQVSFSEGSLKVACKGVLIDYLDGLGGVPHEKSVVLNHSVDPELVQSEAPANLGPPSDQAKHKGKNPVDNHVDERKELLISIVRSLVLDRQDRYLSKPAPVSTYLMDFLQLAASATHDETNPSSFASRRFLPWYTLNKDLLIRGTTLENLCKEPQESTDSMSKLRQTFKRGMRILEGEKGEIDLSEEGFIQRLHDTKAVRRMGRRLCTTRDGRVGMAPMRARKGDAICVLFGCSVPVLLRGLEEEDGEEYEFVGECYLDGFMNGEGVSGNEEVKEFVLC
ncbi:heterokaryon incompatibility protein-domain-containing protein [Cercophora newfieldiana]|uniref:Heterokaryon incompatibility protein-domain-containing protein n=1 Tax=Cercophora newfieldiana TaxID=92897 RepID=A0AA39XVP2_9PEZI|nr:heterokaryon incompatibility protein-domain-containing protein [Cercophora newfieldiana]